MSKVSRSAPCTLPARWHPWLLVAHHSPPRSSQWRWGRPATVPNEEGLPTPCVVNEEALPTFSYPQVLASCTTICSARSSSMVSTITGGNWEGRAPSYQQLPMCRHSKATAGDRWNNGAQKMKWRTVSRSPPGRRWWGACTPKKFVSLLMSLWEHLTNWKHVLKTLL
jgi:hypothetical protein